MTAVSWIALGIGTFGCVCFIAAGTLAYLGHAR